MARFAALGTSASSCDSTNLALDTLSFGTVQVGEGAKAKLSSLLAVITLGWSAKRTGA